MALDKLSHWDDAVLVPLDLLVDVVRLQLRQDLYNGLLPPRLSHQQLVVWSGEPLVLDSDRVDGLHPVPELVVVPC